MLNTKYTTTRGVLSIAVASCLVAAIAGCPTVTIFVDDSCDNGNYCDGIETRVDGICQDGTDVNCDDDVVCTDDSCNESTDSCDNIANDANCDDGLFCNGEETCIDGGCQGATDAYPLGRWAGSCDRTTSGGACTSELVYETPTSGTWQSSNGPGEFTQTGSMVPGGLIEITNTAPGSHIGITNATLSDDGFCMSGTWSNNSGISGTLERCWLDVVLPCSVSETCDEETDSCVVSQP